MEVSDEAFAVQVLEQLWGSLGDSKPCKPAKEPPRCRLLVAGGDWNACLLEVLRMAGSAAGLETVGLSVYAPDGITSLPDCRIDGVVRLEACTG